MGKALKILLVLLVASYCVYPALKVAGVMRHNPPPGDPTSWPVRVLFLVHYEDFRDYYEPSRLAAALYVTNHALLALCILAITTDRFLREPPLH